MKNNDDMILLDAIGDLLKVDNREYVEEEIKCIAEKLWAPERYQAAKQSLVEQGLLELIDSDSIIILTDKGYAKYHKALPIEEGKKEFLKYIKECNVPDFSIPFHKGHLRHLNKLNLVDHLEDYVQAAIDSGEVVKDGECYTIVNG